MCGENDDSITRVEYEEGSPPRVRGKPQLHGLPDSKARITPACAGKTESSPYRLHRAKDHPRVCGENMGDSPPRSRRVGSPPRVRGKPSKYGLKFEGARITPACAGKTSVCGRGAEYDKDHPRVCGENMQRFSLLTSIAGSPPRVRGKP